MQHSSKTDWARVRVEAAACAPVAQDADDLYDPNDPAAVDAFWDAATVRQHGGRGPQKAPTRQAVSLRLSPEVLAYFKAGGSGWQTRLDQALQEYVREHSQP